jgi:hypothetical protein
MRLNSAAVIGSLEIGAKMAPLIQAGQTVSVDTVPPEIRDMAPEEQTNTNDPRPNISAAYDDEGSGIALDSVKMIVNGQDVTSRATVTRDFISYRPDSSLQAGPQQVEIRVRDQAGNRSESHWGFVERQRAESGIKSVSDNVDHAFQPGDTIRAEMVASPGGMAWFSTGSIQKVPMAEAQPGHYVAEYTIRRGDDTADKPIAFHLLSADGQRFEQASNHVVRIATGKPDPPVVTSPGPNEIPGNPLVVLGTARRNSRVRVRIEFRNRVLGLIALQGTAADVSVKVDRDGNWQTEPINLGRVLTNKGTDFTITVTAINAAGEVSEPTTTRFRMQ